MNGPVVGGDHELVAAAPDHVGEHRVRRPHTGDASVHDAVGIVVNEHLLLGNAGAALGVGNDDPHPNGEAVLVGLTVGQ